MVAAGPEWVSVQDAAKLFKVCPATIRRWAREKKIPALRPGGRTIRVIPPSVESWGRSRPFNPDTQEG
jgi:excisionase family DNA binding protein